MTWHYNTWGELIPDTRPGPKRIARRGWGIAEYAAAVGSALMTLVMALNIWRWLQ